MEGNWFVGLPVPTAGWFGRLVRGAPPSVRVFHPDDVHLTVAFFGRVGEQRARLGWERMAGYEGKAIPVSLGRLAPMGNPRRPSALSVILEGGFDEVARLIATLRGPALEAAGAKPDTRPPKPHITVARPQRKASGSERRQAVAWAESKPAVAAAVTLDRLALLSWSEDRRERQFRIVAERALTSL